VDKFLKPGKNVAVVIFDSNRHLFFEESSFLTIEKAFDLIFEYVYCVDAKNSVILQ